VGITVEQRLLVVMGAIGSALLLMVVLLVLIASR
jgi:hypothetical protein